ncbi:Putative MarR family transcriptional regulator [Sinomonas atrocyanea]|uniref:Putative MarR family transcriptional regulator n=1 Tax=Sinomonas atrocyanea TaxID=37927 RepID=A0A127A2V0_9MICC|nr:MarR family winged helix-turn-helix transcriptional regulator [Sinomonas atrocyanea]AMM33124.1 Putative MarR family transcriptional regulator [Sinomonas atrocyanea]GEB65855.1 MarR family transcriptional regulator [Sinomonas atrocyanea]GGG73135.1 MarR family transcriptional regulator [Sinomonas atrocyanea]
MTETTPAPHAGPSVREVSEAWESLFRAQVAVMRRLQRDPAFRTLGINSYDVLFTLSRCEGRGLRLNELNDHVLLAQSSLSRLVERLERQGLVARESAPADGRGVVVRLTEEGARVQREVGRAHVREINRIMGGALDAGDLAALRDLTTRLREHVVADHPL